MIQGATLFKTILLLVGLGVVVWFASWLAFTFNPWIFRSAPLLPPDAYNIQQGFLRNTDDKSVRQTTFSTDSSPEKVLEFYRRHLIARGWSEVEPHGNCGNSLWQGEYMSGTFVKDELQISLSDRFAEPSNNPNQIEIKESDRYVRDIEFPTNMLIGDWVSVDSLGDQAFMFCVNRSENLVLAYTEKQRIHGTQEWQDTTLTITLEGEQNIRSEQDRQASEAFCSTIPPIFAEHCSLEFITRTGSISSGNAPIALQRIEGSYQLAIEQNRFTITSPSGLSQSFIRTAIP